MTEHCHCRDGHDIQNYMLSSFQKALYYGQMLLYSFYKPQGQLLNG